MDSHWFAAQDRYLSLPLLKTTQENIAVTPETGSSGRPVCRCPNIYCEPENSCRDWRHTRFIDIILRSQSHNAYSIGRRWIRVTLIILVGMSLNYNTISCQNPKGSQWNGSLILLICLQTWSFEVCRKVVGELIQVVLEPGTSCAKVPWTLPIK